MPDTFKSYRDGTFIRHIYFFAPNINLYKRFQDGSVLLNLPRELITELLAYQYHTSIRIECGNLHLAFAALIGAGLWNTKTNFKAETL